MYFSYYISKFLKAGTASLPFSTYVIQRWYKLVNKDSCWKLNPDPGLQKNLQSFILCIYYNLW